MLITLAGLIGCCFCAADDAAFPLEVRPTHVVRGPADRPSVVVELEAVRDLGGETVVRIEGAGGVSLFEDAQSDWSRGRVVRAGVPAIDGAAQHVQVVVDNGAARWTEAVAVRMPDREWELHFIPGFHYDPVWWNTQAHYTETGYKMGSSVGPGLALVRAYLGLCREDPDYTVALHQLPYLKTFLEAHPDEVYELLQRIREGRCAIVGGTYNELSSTLISAEATARNAIYGTLFQTEVLRGAGEVFWQCDVFGHDPSFPAVMLDTGHTAGAFARGPFHQWGAPRDQVNFPSEFLWMGPDGRTILTHYMTGHYGYAYGMLAPGTNRAPDDMAECEAIITRMFEDMKRPALTHHVLLPMHWDFIRPMENLGDVVRHWNANYVSPKARVSTPGRFFEAVRREMAERDIAPPVIARDMNPIYTGCPVSYADLKLAQRACEVAVRDAEVLATIAAMEGAPYPWRAIDRVWRQLLFNAHHDGVTGSMSDQVYVDLMYAYRDALETARGVQQLALSYLTDHVVRAPAEADRVVWNTLGRARSAATAFSIGDAALEVGAVPAVGYRAVNSDAPGGEMMSFCRATGDDQVQLDGEALRVTVDLASGGCISSLYDKRLARELLAGPANDIVVHDEYASLPNHGEGPWHLAPTGESHPGTGVRARLIETEAPDTVIVEADYPLFTKRQTIRLADRPARVDCRTEIIRWRGANKLLRAEFPIDLPGARPVFETAAAVIGRPFARDVDTAEDAWTLDNTCWQWGALGRVCAVEAYEGAALVHRRAIGVGEIVIAADAPNEIVREAGRLSRGLVGCGVTTTTTRVDQRRYGDLTYDSNVPDVRILLGRAGAHAMIDAIGADHAIDTRAMLVEVGDALPTVVIAPGQAMEEVLLDLANEQCIRVSAVTSVIDRRQVAVDGGVALVNRGSVSVHAGADGTLGLNLMRSCTSWPAGVWIDEPARRHPDGSALQLMHGSHSFAYSIVPYAGDFRRAGLARVGQQLNQSLHERPIDEVSRAMAEMDGPADVAAGSWLEVAPADVLVAVLKPEGYPEARWMLGNTRADLPDPMLTNVVVRLWNGAGRGVDARLRVRRGTGRAWRAELLESRRETLRHDDGWITLRMRPNVYETVICEIEPAEAVRGDVNLDPTAGDVSPSAYWLENRAEGVTGNGIIAVVPDVREVAVGEAPMAIPVRLVNNDGAQSADLALSLEGPADLPATLSKMDVSIPPRSFAEVALEVSPAGALRSEALLTIVARTPDARRVTGAVWVVPERDDVRNPVIEVENRLAVLAAPGRLRAVLRNHTPGPITGEATWLSPMVVWPVTTNWRQRVTVPANGAIEVQCPVTAGIDSYALLRFAFGGRLVYGEPVALVRDPQDCFMACDVDRLRLTAARTGTVGLRLRSVAGLSAETALTVDAPEGWGVEEVSRAFDADDAGQSLIVRYDVLAAGDGAEATVRFGGPGDASATVAATMTPTQVARPALAEVVVDGDLDEWGSDAFTSVGGDGDSIRAAVRYAVDGLVLAFEVEDDVVVQPGRGSSLWGGDSVQFALTRAPMQTTGYDGVWEMGAGLTRDGPQVWCWIVDEGGRAGPVEGARAAIERDGNVTRYEILLPRSAMPTVPLYPEAVLGFAYVANDNDGDGWRGAIEWADGISGGKDASRFGNLRLMRE